jgi:hypothetical protein
MFELLESHNIQLFQDFDRIECGFLAFGFGFREIDFAECARTWSKWYISIMISALR